MTTDQQKLDASIQQAREVISELNGMRKDLKTFMQQVKAELTKSVEDHIRAVVVPSVEEHNRAMERMHTESVRSLARSNSNAWRAIGKAAFGDKPDPRTIGLVLTMISRAVHDVGKLGGLDVVPDDVVESISAMILGTIHEFDAYDERTFEPFGTGNCPHHGTPPHASVQDKSQGVV